MLSINIYLPAIPAIAYDLHAPVIAVQFTVPAFGAGVAMGQLIWGWSKLRERRVPLSAGAALFVLASLVCAAAPSFIGQWPDRARAFSTG